ncbi:MAG: hypothetical protein AAGN35_18790 [Bacteroidota bacterium]
MTRFLQLALGRLTRTTNQTLAQKIVLLICALAVFAAPVANLAHAKAAPLRIEAAPVGGTLVIVLDNALGTGGTVALNMNPAFTRDFPTCGISVGLILDNSRIIVTLPQDGCVPTSNLEVADITAIGMDGTVAARYSLQAVDGNWEVIEVEL